MLNNRLYSWHASEIMLKEASIYEGGWEESMTPSPRILPLPSGMLPSGTTAAGAGAAAAVSTTNNQDAAETAWFQLGCIYQLKKGNFVKAKEYFNKISQNAKDTVIRNGAVRRIKAIDTLYDLYLLERYGRPRRKAPFVVTRLSSKVGELFWLELELPDSAFVHFKKLAAKSDSLRPKALYSAAYIARTHSRTPRHPTAFFCRFVTTFSRKRLYENGPKGPRRKNHRAYPSGFRAGCLSQGREPVLLIPTPAKMRSRRLKRSMVAYPDCDQGLKALYAAGMDQQRDFAKQ